MAQKEEILDKLAELAEQVTHARESMLRGEIVALAGVQECIEEQCQAIVDLEPSDAAEIKPSLDALLGDLRLFSEEIEYVQAKVAEILENAEQPEGEDPDSES